jgi:hypothetical protein
MLPRIELATFLVMLIVAVVTYLILTTSSGKAQPVFCLDDALQSSARHVRQWGAMADFMCGWLRSFR